MTTCDVRATAEPAKLKLVQGNCQQRDEGRATPAARYASIPRAPRAPRPARRPQPRLQPGAGGAGACGCE